MMDKAGSYSKYVKEMYWPKVSEKKKFELNSILRGAQSQTELRLNHSKK